MRRLDLHSSALSDDEYQYFTTSFAQIALDDVVHDEFEGRSLRVREARAWLRGRYSHLPAHKIDEILRFFSPNLAETDTLSAGEFFAALRLVVHAETGKDTDRTLAFVQSKYGSLRSLHTNTITANPRTSQQESANPFKSNNPFVTRSKSFSSSRSQDSPSKLPPLPPRKPPPPVPSQPLPPPRHAALITPSAGPAIKPASHVTSTLMKQSLQASKTAQTMKKAEEQLEKERVLQVLKSSSSTPRNRSISPAKIARSSSSASGSEDAPPLPRRRHPKDSPPLSSSSLERVALAGTSDSGSSPFKSTGSPSVSPSRNNVDLPNGPPPTHPDRKPSFQSTNKHFRTISLSKPRTSSPEPFETESGPPSHSASPYTTTFEGRTGDSPTSRIFRSKSVHHPTPQVPPVPPPSRRKRPESFQFNSAPSDSDSPLSNFQRTLANLQPKLDALQPKLDKARYKAEAGLSKRGFVRDGSRSGVEGEKEGLVDRSEGSVFDDTYAFDRLDSPSSKDWDRDGEWRVEKDSDKWPLEQGWKPL